MPLGIAIRKRRLKLGLTQQELAERAGLTAAADVSKIESGKVWPPEQKIYALSDALQCHVAELFSEEAPDLDNAIKARQYKDKAVSNEELLNFGLALNALVTEVHVSFSRLTQIVFHSIANQLDDAKLLADIKMARDRIESEPAENKMLKESLNCLIEQLMEAARSRR